MVMKPAVFVTAGALVIVAAGVGAYIAVRQNAAGPSAGAERSELQSSASLPDTGGSSASGALTTDAATMAVESTEEILTPAPEEGLPDAAPAKREKADTAASPPPHTESPAEEPTPKSAVPARTDRPVPPPSRRAANDLPEIDGWERLDAPWPASRQAADPEQVALATVAPDSLGLLVDPEPRPPVIEALVVSADSVVGLQIDTFVTSASAEVEDDVEARVTRDVMVSDRVAIPAGTVVMGSVVLVEQSGKLKGASRLGVRFHTVVFDDGVEVPIVTETVYREGRPRGGESAAKIGGAAVGGAILGAIFGGGRGAAIGGAAGAAGGTAAAVAGDAEPATLPAGTSLTVRLSRPATVTVEH